MIRNNNIRTRLQCLIAIGSICLMLGVRAYGEQKLVQPLSVIADQQPIVDQTTGTAQLVTPVSCTDTCCGDGCCQGDGCGSGCCGNCCCEAVCCPKRVTEEVKKHCWKVESEMVCIPGYRFQCNWNKPKCGKSGCDTCCGDTCGAGCCDGCPPKCGRVRCINVLEKHEYTCEECGYEWEVKCVRSSNGCCSRGRCNCPSCGKSHGCCASIETPTTDVQLTAATEDTSEAEPKSEEPSLARRVMNWFK